jgi:hypothetical protein
VAVLLRYVLLAFLFYAAVRLLIRLLRFLMKAQRTGHPGGYSSRRPDASKEVKTGSFNIEDVQDAKFKDM